jgi:hypothetical protein
VAAGERNRVRLRRCSVLTCSMQTSGTRETRFHLGFYRQPVTYPHPPTEAEAVRLFRGGGCCVAMAMLMLSVS